MDMNGEYRIPAPQQAVWDALNDPDILREAIPGCETLNKLSDTEMEAAATAKVGPVKAKFKGKINLSDIDAPNSYTLTGEGKGGAAGFAKGSAKVSLSTEGSDTLLRYDVQATVGGKLAQIGQRLIDAAAKKMSDEFFTKFSEQLGGSKVEEPEPTIPQPAASTSAPPVPQEGVHPAIWVTGVLIAVLIILVAFGNI